MMDGVDLMDWHGKGNEGRSGNSGASPGHFVPLDGDTTGHTANA